MTCWPSETRLLTRFIRAKDEGARQEANEIVAAFGLLHHNNGATASSGAVVSVIVVRQNA